MKERFYRDTGRLMTLHALSAILIITLLIQSLPTAGNAQSGVGIDCECDAVGDYVDPDNGYAPKVNPDSTSPNGKYRIEISVVNPTIYLTVRRVSNNEIVYSTNVDGNSEPKWGFSPDDDRFLFQYLLSGVHYATLIDLSVSPGQQRWTTAVATGAARVRFSPSGGWLLYAALTSTTHTLLYVIDARTGATAYQSEFDFQPVPDPDEKWGMVNWGFSSDSLNRTLVYAFLTGQSSVEWFVVNLQKHSVVREATLTGISAFWQFSPCGDIVGIVLQTNPSVIQAQLYRTVGNQTPVSSQTFSIGDPVTLQTTASSHTINVGGTNHVLATNGADAICTVAPTSLTIVPDFLYGRAVGGDRNNYAQQSGVSGGAGCFALQFKSYCGRCPCFNYVSGRKRRAILHNYNRPSHRV